jgi:hypothetical protein
MSPDYIYILARQPCDCRSGARRSECCYADLPVGAVLPAMLDSTVSTTENSAYMQRCWPSILSQMCARRIVWVLSLHQGKSGNLVTDIPVCRVTRMIERRCAPSGGTIICAIALMSGPSPIPRHGTQASQTCSSENKHAVMLRDPVTCNALCIHSSCMLQGCKWHKPDGCPPETFGCPWCLTTPALTVLINIANHLELVKGTTGLCWWQPNCSAC